MAEDFKRRLRTNLLMQRSVQIVNKTRGTPIRFLKPKQVDCMLSYVHDGPGHYGHGKDMLCVLPTGYGKTLVFQLLPVFHSLLHGESEASSVAIVVSPLNAIISQQKLIFGKQAKIIAERVYETDEELTSGGETGSEGDLESLSSLGRSRSPSPVRSLPDGIVEEEEEEEETRSSSGDFTSSASSSNLKGYGHKFYLGHPEQFLEDTTMQSMATASWAKSVHYIFIDEAHCVTSWGDNFRPKYKELDRLRAIFPEACIVAVTATATTKMQQDICRILAMKNVVFFSGISDRPNIKYSVQSRQSQSGKNTAEKSYNAVFIPYLTELKEKKGLFQKTVIYTGLKWCGIGSEQGVRLLADGNVRSEGVQEIAQFHAPLTAKTKEDVATRMSMEASPLRLLFATDAYGMGVDCPDIRRIVHAGAPRTLEAYSQQTGRAGRDGAPAEAIMFVNKEDLGRQTVEQDMKDYCRLTTCRRVYLAQHFGTAIDNRPGHAHNCCDNCATSCSCDSCLLSTSAAAASDDSDEVSEDQQVALFNALVDYFAGVNMSQTSSAIDPALVTGLTQEVAQEIADNSKQLRSKDVLEVAYAHIQPDILENIFGIIQAVQDLVF